MANTTSRVLKQSNPTLTLSWYINGTATDVGDVTITLTDLAGTAAVTAASTTNNNDGTYEYTLADAQTNNVGYYVATWNDTDTSDERTTIIEVVGQHLVSEAQVRAHDPALANTSDYPDEDILVARDQITDLLEQWTGRSWVPRYRRAQFSGDGGQVLFLRDAEVSEGGSSGEGSGWDCRSVLSSTVSGVSVTPTVMDDSLYRSGGWSGSSSPLNVVVEYEYGQQIIRDGVDRIALLLIRDRLVPSNIDARTISITNDFGSQRFVTEGGPMKNVSRIPEVNEWVRNHDVRPPIV